MKKISLKDIDIHDTGINIGIAGVLWCGAGKTFVTIFPDMDMDEITANEIEAMTLDLDEWLEVTKQMDFQETKILMNVDGSMVKSFFRKTQRTIDGKIQWRVYARDNFTCCYCGKRGIPMSVDHIDLWENGGVTNDANLLCTCRKCNKARGNTPYKKWIESDKYKRLSANLSDDRQKANLSIIKQLPQLKKQRMYHVRSR